MKKLWAIVLLSGIAGLATGAFSAERAGEPQSPQMQQSICVQIVSCGTKNGKRKQYPTPCAARDDGAKNVTPLTGPTCEEPSK